MTDYRPLSRAIFLVCCFERDRHGRVFYGDDVPDVRGFYITLMLGRWFFNNPTPSLDEVWETEEAYQ